MKQCSKCDEFKILLEFNKCKSSKDGLQYKCKKCERVYYDENFKKIRERSKIHKETNKEEIAKKNKKYREANKESIIKYQKDNKEALIEYRKRYRDANKDAKRKYQKQYQYMRRQSDPLFRTVCNLRNRLSTFCKYAGLEKNFKTLDSVGLCPSEFKLYIESLFAYRMNWENYGKGDDKWSIDHIKPLCTAKTIEDIYKLNHYTNLQPLWNPDNFSKNGKWEDNLI